MTPISNGREVQIVELNAGEYAQADEYGRACTCRSLGVDADDVRQGRGESAVLERIVRRVGQLLAGDAGDHDGPVTQDLIDRDIGAQQPCFLKVGECPLRGCEE